MTNLFGTDGIRGIANSQLTPQLAFEVGKCASRVLAKHASHRPRILLGADTRISRHMLEAALACGICSAGADVAIAGVIPTPGVALLTASQGFDAGAVISASHNPFEYNGIKFFDNAGRKLSDELEEEIEALINGQDGCEPLTGEHIGRCSLMQNAAKLYENHLQNAAGIELSGLKIALDCANGAAFEIAPRLFKKLGAQVVTMGTSPDGTNINRGCGSTHMQSLSQLVKAERCHMGLAFDGDADRMLAVDQHGKFVDGDQIMAIISLCLKSQNKLNGDTLVATVMSNMGLDIFAEKHQIRLAKTAVGDRYVLEYMMANDCSLGGEQSGHIILAEHATTGDGILSALWLLKSLKHAGESLAQAADIMQVLPQVLKSVRVSEQNKAAAMADERLLEYYGEIERKLNGRGRLLVRASGTEPLIRVMLEGADLAAITSLANDITARIAAKYA
jgi:phosphoglucosamine mutase